MDCLNILQLMFRSFIFSQFHFLFVLMIASYAYVYITTAVESSIHWEKGFILNLGICIGKWMNI